MARVLLGSKQAISKPNLLPPGAFCALFFALRRQVSICGETAKSYNQAINPVSCG